MNNEDCDARVPIHTCRPNVMASVMDAIPTNEVVLPPQDSEAAAELKYTAYVVLAPVEPGFDTTEQPLGNDSEFTVTFFVTLEAVMPTCDTLAKHSSAVTTVAAHLPEFCVENVSVTVFVTRSVQGHSRCPLWRDQCD